MGNIMSLTSPFSKCKQDDIKLLTKMVEKVCSCDRRTTQTTGNHYRDTYFFFFFFFLPVLFYKESFAVKKKVLNIPTKTLNIHLTSFFQFFLLFKYFFHPSFTLNGTFLLLSRRICI